MILDPNPTHPSPNTTLSTNHNTLFTDLSHLIGKFAESGVDLQAAVEISSLHTSSITQIPQHTPQFGDHYRTHHPHISLLVYISVIVFAYSPMPPHCPGMYSEAKAVRLVQRLQRFGQRSLRKIAFLGTYSLSIRGNIRKFFYLMSKRCSDKETFVILLLSSNCVSCSRGMSVMECRVLREGG